MDLRSTSIVYYFKLKHQIEALSERDRVLSLFLALFAIFIVWYLVLLGPQKHYIDSTNKEIQDINTQIDKIGQKKLLIESMVGHRETRNLIKRYNELTLQLKDLDRHSVSYDKQYISSHNLSKLLDDMLKQTNGVIIDTFRTVVKSGDPSKQTAASTSADASPNKPTSEKEADLSVEPVHYLLVLKGNYFSIMNYLKSLEALPWKLYWDKFDYSVTKFPEGVATVSFYTLKPHNNRLLMQPLKGAK